MPYDPRQDPKYKDNKLFLSLINQESRFNSKAVSPTGARGYTQVLPSTARDPGFGLTPNVAALTDPEQNVAFGKAYFDAMQKRYKGDNAAALVAYNGGPGAADRWIANGKNDKVISPESRNYYKTILKSAGEGYDFSKIKQTSIPKGVPTTDDESEETEKTTGFAKLKIPGSKAVDPKADEAKDTSDGEAESTESEEEKPAAKVKATKASKKEDNEDDDDDDDSSSSGGHKSDFSFDVEAAVPKLKPFEPGASFKLGQTVLGTPKLQIAALELDNPRDR